MFSWYEYGRWRMVWMDDTSDTWRGRVIDRACDALVAGDGRSRSYRAIANRKHKVNQATEMKILFAHVTT